MPDPLGRAATALGSRAIRRAIRIAPWLMLCAAEAAASPADRTPTNDDHRAWPADIVDWRSSPVDLAFLNAAERPAGKRGFVRAVGDRLQFADGSPARFWGTNLSASALFGTSRDEVRRQARRLSALGFNLVRLHHHDSRWVKPNIFGDPGIPDTQSLSPAMLDRLDWWIKCLKDEGIYTWLDLHVGRQFKPADRIDDFAEIAKSKPAGEIKGFNYVNRSIIEAMKRFNEAYVNHENKYTRLRYKDDPAIAAMLLTNENDLTRHFGNSLLPSNDVPQHSKRYMAEANAFADRWRLDKDKVWRSWEAGPSKIFLSDLEHRFNDELIRHLRAQGVRVPIVTTSSWGNNPLSSLPALTDGDMVDVHAYGGSGELEKNPLHAAGMIASIAAARVAGKPLSITEWNVEGFPAPDRHSIPLYMAAFAARQGWSAPVQFAYAQVALNAQGEPSNWDAYDDPALLATLPAAALLFRRGDVREAGVVYAFAPGAEDLFDQPTAPRNSVALRTAVEVGKLQIVLPPVTQLPWLRPSSGPAAARRISDPGRALLPENAQTSATDDGELVHNWQRGQLLLNTPRTQAATGWIGGEVIKCADVEIAVRTRYASVAVQSLDDRPIAGARALLISLGARAVPSEGGHLPYHAEPVIGRLSIRAPAGRRLYAMNGAASRRALPVEYRNGRYLIDLDQRVRSYWLVLK